MRMATLVLLGTTIAMSRPNLAPAQEAKAGTVGLPLATYDQLRAQVRGQQEGADKPAPAAYAIGKVEVTVNVQDTGARSTATVTAVVSVRVFDDEWVLVPLLSAGTAVTEAYVDGSPAQLVASSSGLAWAASESGNYQISLTYSVDASKFEAGSSVGIPIPAAAATRLTATLPGTGLDVVVIPSAGLNVSPSGEVTHLTATLPRTNAVHISWRTPGEGGHSVSRARYVGNVVGDAVDWEGELEVEIKGSESVVLALLPKRVTLKDVRVDGKPASIDVRGDQFVTTIKGRGRHKVTVSFQVPVNRDGGPPRIDLAVPAVPVTRFELTLPGEKEINVTPAANVSHKKKGGKTVATVNVPMTTAVSFSWSEAVPEAVKAELRANADIYHLVHAEEGVLYVRAMIRVQITRGETNTLTLEVPRAVQVNDVLSDAGGIADWRPNPPKGGGPQTIEVFFDRQIKGEYPLDLYYERKLETGSGKAKTVKVPLVRVAGVNRQRGMVALLASKDFTLNPSDEAQVTRVGENQLPTMVREVVDKTIAHTYKYLEGDPTILVQAAPPERQIGKFDVQIDTLISLSDVTIRGSASIEVNVKSGGIQSLEVALPDGVNFLSLTAPSLRSRKVETRESGQRVIDVQFTQEMEGQFRLEVTYERIITDGAAEAPVPTLNVLGAEVEQGRIAVEALTAVEVEAARTDQLSKVDINELPQQLILKTSNPILLAYKYVQVEPPYALTLKVTRHRELDVQVASIDTATYRTLYTKDGLAVTSATFVVRNSRKQFLKLDLPPGSEVWSVFVNGRSEKPALDEDAVSDDGGISILVKIINSTEGFPVEIIYATPVSEISSLGSVMGRLPRPDMVVTDTRWDVFLPAGITYGQPSTNMNVVDSGTHVAGSEMPGMSLGRDLGGQVTAPLRIVVPTSGHRISFEKIYANRSKKHASFSMAYASEGGAYLAQFASAAGAALVWLAIFLAALSPRRIGGAVACAVGGIGLLGVSTGYLGTGLSTPLLVSVLGAGLIVAKVVMDRRRVEEEHVDEDEEGAKPPKVS